MWRLLVGKSRFRTTTFGHLLSSTMRTGPRSAQTHHLLPSSTPFAMASTASDVDWTRIVKPDIPPYSVYVKPIQKSERDEREYRVIRLENGLEATVIHDSETDKAAASLGVAVGHLNDPVSEAVLRSSITEECGTVLKD